MIEEVSMLFKNITCTLFIIFSCITVSFMNAGKKKISRAKMSTQYRASSTQIINFLSRQNAEIDVLWKNYWQDYMDNRVNVDDLRQAMKDAFQAAAQDVRFDDNATVLDLLKNCFGKSVPEEDFIQYMVNLSIERQNKERGKIGKKNWKQSQRWPACLTVETAQKVLCSISEGLSQFLDRIQAPDHVPDFWIVVTNLKAGSEFRVKIDCITDVPLLEQAHDMESELGNDNDNDYDLSSYANFLECCYYAQQCCCYAVLPIVVGVIVGGVLTANFL